MHQPALSVTLHCPQPSLVHRSNLSPSCWPQDFIFQQTMLRVRDPQPSLDFYTRVLGMTLLAKLDFPSMSFTLFFLGYEKVEDIPEDPAERVRHDGDTHHTRSACSSDRLMCMPYVEAWPQLQQAGAGGGLHCTSPHLMTPWRRGTGCRGV